MKDNEILITVKPSTHRDMVLYALESQGWTFTGSGYDLVNGVGDLVAVPPAGSSPDEFGPAIDPNIPTGQQGPPA